LPSFLVHRCTRITHAAETDVGGRAGRFALAASPGEVARAKILGTQERAAALDALGDALVKIEPGLRARRVLRRTVLVIIELIPVAAPLPDVARHVIQSVSVGGEGTDRGGAVEAVLLVVGIGEIPLPVVAHPLLAGVEFIAPAVGFAIEAAASRKLPLGLRGQALVRPLAVFQRVEVTNVYHGVLRAALEI